MPEVKFNSIGANSRKVIVEEAEIAERRKELIEKFTAMPMGFTIEQWSVWMMWGTVVASVFLYCTVSAVMMAIH